MHISIGSSQWDPVDILIDLGTEKALLQGKAWSIQ
jgi:hypothetical protein